MAGKISSGGGGKRSALTPTSDPNVIPFIDILLVLLIIFMVTAPIPTVDLRVDLPPPNPRPTPPEDGKRPTIVSLVDNQGYVTYQVDGQPVEFAQISDKVLERSIENNWAIPIEDIYAEARIFVRADQRTTYGRVVQLMSRLQEDGFVKVGIFAEQASTEG